MEFSSIRHEGENSMLELIGLYPRTAMRETSSTAFLSNARDFALCSRARMVSPGRLSPGRTGLDKVRPLRERPGP
jgi:hypothetical protein